MKKQTKKIAQENFLDEIETHYSKIDKVIDTVAPIIIAFGAIYLLGHVGLQIIKLLYK